MIITVQPQLSQILKDNKPQTILKEVADILNNHYDKATIGRVRSCFSFTVNLFQGKHERYKKCNTYYHDLPHTLDVFLAAARILDGYIIVFGKMDEASAVQLLMASLLHDAGYIQERDDHEGTGAKYTFNHVMRSMDFVRKNKKDLSITKEDAEAVARIIKATEFSLDFRSLSFASTDEQRCGAILATADLMGQMADRLYLEKLLYLYNEFREAGMPGFNTEFDIHRNTAAFYEATADRLERSLQNIGRYARFHFFVRYNIDENLYEMAIQRNMKYRMKIMRDATTNFRKKLNRNTSVDESYYNGD
jgi:HD superfamily phosphodiesterase